MTARPVIGDTVDRHSAAEPPAPVQPGAAVRVGAALAVGFVAVVLLASLREVPPGAGRLDRSVDIVELIRLEQQRVEQLAAEVEALSAQVAAHERAADAGGIDIGRLRAELDELAVPSGMTGVLGPGLKVTLRDSRLTPPRGTDYNNYIIHEQDLQAVINALWAGGAEAMSVNDNRILATTAIRCVGNVLLLHGKTYSPPYEIVAIGDQAELRDALDRDAAVARFAHAVQQFQLGFAVEIDEQLLVPGFEGVSAMSVARPLES